MNPYILLLLGYFLILLEFYLPGAVMGVMGSILVLFSMITFSTESPSIIWTIVFNLLALAGVAALIKFAIWKIPRTKSSFSIYSNDDQEGYQASSFDPTTIGKEGVVLSDLKPGGYILVDGKQNQAISISGYIEKGKKVIVIKGQEESLIVREAKDSEDE